MTGFVGLFARLRGLAIAAVLVAALGVAGCGSDDDDGGSAQDSSSDSGSASVKADIEAVYGEFIGNVYAGRYPQACDGFTSSYRARYPSENKLAKTCVGTMRKEFANMPRDGQPKLVRVKLHDPSNATGFSSVDGKVKDAILVGFEKEQGQWRLNGAAKEDEE